MMVSHLQKIASLTNHLLKQALNEKEIRERFLKEGFICWIAREIPKRKPHFLPMQSQLLRSRTSALQHLDFEQE